MHASILKLLYKTSTLLLTLFIHNPPSLMASFTPLLLLLFFFFFSSIAISDDLETLLSLKQSLLHPTKPTNAFKNWLPNQSHYCNFTGITCHPTSSRVISISISFTPLFGNLPPIIGKLTHLQNLTIVSANLTGKIPPEISSLTSLTFLNLSNNNLFGEFPGSHVRLMSSLQLIDVYNNNFTGKLPAELSEMRNLTYLGLGGNYFSGEIPASYSEFENLTVLLLNGNSLTGEIPASLSRLKKLKRLCLGYFNDFSGGIPPEFGSLSSLEYLDIANAKISGGIPKELGKLKKLNTLFLQQNNLAGEIPSELSELESLMSLDLSTNQFSGELPKSFANLKNLTLINLFHNNLVGGVSEIISNLPNLQVFQVWSNNFTLELPENFGSNGQLYIVDITSNHFTGSIPRNLCKSQRLKWLMMTDNALIGPIPDELGRCNSLNRLRLAGNQLNGTIPLGLFNLPNLEIVELSQNLISGDLPPMMYGKKLGILNLSTNLIAGKIPPMIGNISKLQSLYLQNNHLDEEIPPELFRLKQLQNLNLSGNSLSGEIPVAIGDCSSLIVADLSRNNFSGEIPNTISSLNSLGTLNLSRNSLTGYIPTEMSNIPTLSILDLSNNNLYGGIPIGGHFSAFKPSWFEGNPNLCWPPRGQPCPVYTGSKTNHKWSFTSARIILLVIAGLTCILLSVLTFIIRRQKLLESSKAWKVERFHRHDFKAEDVIEWLKEENIIGKGGAGVVYRGSLPDGTDVAIKKLTNRVGSGRNDHGFAAEIATLGRIRHRNIVRLLGCVSNKETNLLVYEYMANGSLGEKLHGPKGAHLGWDMRYKIAVDAAKGLCYLHHDCSPRIFHRDVKSNNILLDSDYEAHVSDFGLAKFLRGAGFSESMSSIAGSYGYIAPEYAYTLKVDEKSDVYSFGVVLLELIAGKKPVGEFGDGVDIVRWVMNTQMEISQPSDAATVLAILDSRLTTYQLSNVINVFQIAMLCIEEESSRRPTMREVVHLLTMPPPNPVVDPIHALL